MAMTATNLIGKTNRTLFTENTNKRKKTIGTICNINQAILVIDVKWSILYMESSSVKTTEVTLPPDYLVLVFNWLIHFLKLLTLGTEHNRRAIECRFTLTILLEEIRITHKKESHSKVPTWISNLTLSKYDSAMWPAYEERILYYQ